MITNDVIFKVTLHNVSFKTETKEIKKIFSKVRQFYYHVLPSNEEKEYPHFLFFPSTYTIYMYL